MCELTLTSGVDGLPLRGGLSGCESSHALMMNVPDANSSKWVTTSFNLFTPLSATLDSSSWSVASAFFRLRLILLFHRIDEVFGSRYPPYTVSNSVCPSLLKLLPWSSGNLGGKAQVPPRCGITATSLQSYQWHDQGRPRQLGL